jgi:DNA-directed RNA polymerase specialized sigma24 family protein
MPDIKPDSAGTCALLDQVRRGDRPALERLLERFRPDLHALIDCRLDPRLRARVDPSDLVQEAQLEVVRRMDDYLARRPMPFHLWVRKTAYQRLLNARRDHGRRTCRSVNRERPYRTGRRCCWPGRSSPAARRPASTWRRRSSPKRSAGPWPGWRMRTAKSC